MTYIPEDKTAKRDELIKQAKEDRKLREEKLKRKIELLKKLGLTEEEAKEVLS